MMPTDKRKETKQRLLDELGDRLVDFFTQQRFGGDGPSLARAHGFVDGCMRILLDSGLVTKRELLALVAEKRELVDGPAKRVDAAAVQAA